MVHQLIYVSSATRPMSQDDLRLLLDEIRPKNKAAGITGLLLYCDGSFLQVLEGPRETVLSLTNRIQMDSRHARFLVLSSRAVEQADYSEWSMGFRALSSEDWSEVDGFVDFFGDNPIEAKSLRAQKLIDTFRAVNDPWNAAAQRPA